MSIYKRSFKIKMFRIKRISPLRNHLYAVHLQRTKKRRQTNIKQQDDKKIKQNGSNFFVDYYKYNSAFKTNVFLL